MKKGFLVLGLLLLAAGLVLTGCPNNNNDTPRLYVEITLDARGGEFADGWSHSRVNVARGSTIIPTRGVWRDGYTLVEWNTHHEGEGDTLTAQTRHNVHARFFAIWQPLGDMETVEVMFRANDGVFEDGLGIRVQTIAEGGTARPWVVTRDGFEFVEWNTDPGGLGDVLTVETPHYVDTEYWAIWVTDEFRPEGAWYFYPDVAAEVMNGFYAWVLEGEIIGAMMAADTGSMLRLHFDATGGDGDDRGNWGIGNIGIPPRTDPPAPANIIALTAPAGVGLIYRIYVEVEWLLEILDESDGEILTVRTHRTNGDMLTQATLMVPNEPRTDIPARPAPPAPPTIMVAPPEGGELVRQITLDTEAGNIAIGQGNIDGAELAFVRETRTAANLAGRDILLRIYVRNTGHASATLSWDVGQINGVTHHILGAPLASPERHNDVSQETLWTLLYNNHADAPSPPGSGWFINPYNNHVVTRIELWTVPTPAPYVEIEVAGEPQNVVVIGTGGAATHFQDGTGFRFNAGVNHRDQYAQFRVDFGLRRLSDFAYIEFYYNVRDNGVAVRRMALIASPTRLTGRLDTHPGPSGSGSGWLNVGQVSPAMATEANIQGLHTLEIIRDFDPTYKAGLTPTEIEDFVGASDFDAYSALYLSIYEHTAAPDIEISNIRLVLRAVHCDVCDTPGECASCTLDIGNVAADITAQGPTFAVATAAGTNTLELARAAVAEIIAYEVDLRGASITVVAGVFTVATDAAPGSLTFTVQVRKGSGTPQAVGPFTLIIPAATPCPDCSAFPCVCVVYVFNLQTYLEALTPGLIAGRTEAGSSAASTEHLASTHPSELIAIMLREDNVTGNRYLLVDRTQPNSTRGLLLRDLGFRAGDILTIEGRLVTAGLEMRLQGQPDTYMPGSGELNRVGGTEPGPFTITYTVTERFVQNPANGFRIMAHNDGIASQFHIYDMTVTRIGRDP